MPRATDKKSWLVLFPTQEPPRLINNKEVRYHRIRHSGFLLCSPDVLHDSASRYLDPILKDVGYVRLFENFYFQIGEPDARRTALLKSFFEWLAGSYEKHVTKDLNRACYNHLISIAIHTTHINHPKVLDFGCGPGGALDSIVSSVASRLVGYDFSDGMLVAAKLKGMEVLSRAAFDNLGHEVVDVVMSAYVLHYGLTKKELNQLLLTIRPGGAFVANFHKDLGVSDMVRNLQGLPSSHYNIHWETSEFGRCVCIAKQPISSSTNAA